MNQERTILIVDDDPLSLTYLERVLRRFEWSIHVLRAPTRAEALELLRNERVDCIVLDALFHGAEGARVVEEFRALGVKAPIVGTTEFESDATGPRMVRAGAVDFVPKVGFSADRFVGALARAMGIGPPVLRPPRLG